jgi:resuscitation-promoting factor RpfB
MRPRPLSSLATGEGAGEESPFFDLSAISFSNAAAVTMIDATGMFSYPAVSPSKWDGKGKNFQVAYLQSIFIEQSETSRYRLMVMDRDGSNSRAIFPPSDTNGIEPQTPIWSPEPLEGQLGNFIAIIHQRNLWLVDSGNGEAYQVTGDGLINSIDWK